MEDEYINYIKICKKVNKNVNREDKKAGIIECSKNILEKISKKLLTKVFACDRI